jgi:hypothetical protein
MTAHDDETVFHFGMRPGRTYVSKSFSQYGGNIPGRLMRIAARVIDSDDHEILDAYGSELVIRRNPGGRQEIKAVFYEDDRFVERLIFQRFVNGQPNSRQSFSFRGEEIEDIRSLLELVLNSELDHHGKLRFSDRYLDELLSDDSILFQFLERNLERIAKVDSVGEFALYLEFCQRQRQLGLFEQLLYDAEYFQHAQVELGGRGPEAVWQGFFERNPWVFGLGLAPVFLSALDGKKLEQVVSGYSIAAEGKRVDALMKTNGLLSALCFVELKTHQTPLLASKPYRPGAWAVSSEVSGAIAQCHATVQAAMERLQTRLSLIDDEGNPVGEDYFLYRPRSYLVVGCLEEFTTINGANELKFRSFELFRRSLGTPEVVTFDELLERARASLSLGSVPTSTGAAQQDPWDF